MRKHLGFIAVVATMIGAAFAAPASAHEVGDYAGRAPAFSRVADRDQQGERALGTYREGEQRERREGEQRERERERARFELNQRRVRERREHVARRDRFERFDRDGR
jgi:hypothetical protein